ncbi:MAG: hypothetical protein C0390_06345 [Syntrophus sp. (in: bacteria)]|nr:hypothetical protein [Syntrophus sp. (in: bacteria)]
MAKIFISYSSQDSDFATRLRDDLNIIGHTPWIDVFEITPGENIVSRIQEGIKDCKYAIVIVSKASIDSKWVDNEWKESFWQSHSEGSLRIVPVLKEKCVIPIFLRTMKYADFTQSYAVGFSMLCIRLKMSLVNPRLPDDLIPMNYLNAIEWDAQKNTWDHIRLACAHTVWSFRPDRAKPILENALHDDRDIVRNHARSLLEEFY